jgi:alcohol dehydrogenase (cytochrome c)
MTRAMVLCVALAWAMQAPATRPTGTDSWPTFNGDYSGRRFSSLTKINDKNVKHLSMAWTFRVSGQGAAPVKSTPLQVGGVLYFSSPDHVWAVDARTGREIWHFIWEGKGGNYIGNRGVGILGDTVYVETPDCHLVALNINDGKERWRQPVCDLDRYYYASAAPIVIPNHVIVGVSGDDVSSAGYIDARDPATGALQWRWYSVPQKPGDPGLETWPSLEVAKYGGGMTWTPVTYDPELKLIYLTTGNPQPVVAHANRTGANLFTASIVAIDAADGKMRWYFQASPHDTHDWDATQTAVLIDGEVNGERRKLLAQASRNGKYFLLDRVTGKALVSSDFVPTNWSLGFDERGQPIPNPAKHPQIDGALVAPNQAGASNWPSPSFSPSTGLFYVSAAHAYSVWYIYDASKNPMGWGGTDRGGWAQHMVQAIDYATGKIRWSHKWEGSGFSGLLSTAGNVLFTGDGSSNNFVALSASSGEPLWRAGVRTPVSNGPITYTLDGLQYVVVAAGDTLWAFVMNE